jgi:hypothetical protein
MQLRRFVIFIFAILTNLHHLEDRTKHGG